MVPETNVPDCGKLTVESTFKIEDPADTLSINFVLGVIIKLPSTEDLPSFPIYNWIL